LSALKFARVLHLHEFLARTQTEVKYKRGPG
jgi:hypothetical protein